MAISARTLPRVPWCISSFIFRPRHRTHITTRSPNPSGRPRRIVEIFSRLGAPRLTCIDAIIALSVVLPSLERRLRVRSASALAAWPSASRRRTSSREIPRRHTLAGDASHSHIGDQIVSGPHRGPSRTFKSARLCCALWQSQRRDSEQWAHPNRVVVNTAYEARAFIS